MGPWLCWFSSVFDGDPRLVGASPMLISGVLEPASPGLGRVGTHSDCGV